MNLMNSYRTGELLNQFNNELNRFFDTSTTAATENANASWVPAVDIFEDGKAYKVRADIPGVNPKDVDIEFDNGVLVIKGDRAETRDAENVSYRRSERVAGSFYRAFSLPEAIDANAISAKTENGVLEVSIPRQAKPEPKKIKVSG